VEDGAQRGQVVGLAVDADGVAVALGEAVLADDAHDRTPEASGSGSWAAGNATPSAPGHASSASGVTSIARWTRPAKRATRTRSSPMPPRAPSPRPSIWQMTGS